MEIVNKHGDPIESGKFRAINLRFPAPMWGKLQEVANMREQTVEGLLTKCIQVGLVAEAATRRGDKFFITNGTQVIELEW